MTAPAGAMETDMDSPIPKEQWGQDPWQEEPDELRFEAAGFQCALIRSATSGSWCGYVEVRPKHPWYRKHYDKIHKKFNVLVHGGLTFAMSCGRSRTMEKWCRCPEGTTLHSWWVGFDCGHAFDLMPGLAALTKALGVSLPGGETYRDIKYATRQVTNLAKQARAAALEQGEDHEQREGGQTETPGRSTEEPQRAPGHIPEGPSPLPGGSDQGAGSDAG